MTTAMINVQRQFGRLRHRSADEAHVSVLLKEFDDADQMLAKLIDSCKAWRDAWLSILSTQLQLVVEFEGIYRPIVGSSEPGNDIEYAETPEAIVQRTAHLKEVYEELKNTVLDEVNMVDNNLVRPAMDARDSIQPIKKVIKKREDKKLDFELYQGRVDNSKKKMKRSDRENASLAKSEAELARAKQDYKAADERLAEALPPILTASFSLVPQLLSQQILIQNNLLGHCYTALHNYCQGETLPSPPPAMDQILAAWKGEFRPIQHELETRIASIAAGKAVRRPMEANLESVAAAGAYPQRREIAQRQTSGPILTRRAIEAGTPPASSQALVVPDPRAGSALPSLPAALSSPSQTGDVRTLGHASSHSPTTRPDTLVRSQTESHLSVLSSAAAKKKPPPPPPPKKRQSQGVWVTALYDFDGLAAGDLTFKKGDRIRVFKQTESTDDWWEGELKGTQGAFPANYCHAG